MRGSAAVFIIGMFAAAIVGIAASFAMQSVLPETAEVGQAPDTTDVVASVVSGQLNILESNMQQQIDQLTASVDALSGNVQELRGELKNFRLQAPVALSGSTGEGGPEAPVASSNLGEAINRVLDDRDQRREEERTQEREQRAVEMRERFKGMMTSRTERYGEEKGWDAVKTEQVKQIMGDYMEKMSELGGGMMFGRRRGGGRGTTDESREQMTQLREETKAKLLGVVTEEEATELLQGGMGGGGYRPGGDRRPGTDRGGR